MYKSQSTQLLLSILLLGTLLCAQTLPVKPTDKIYLGFLDDSREEMVNWKPGVASQRVIRPAFEKTLSGWKEVDPSSLPSGMKWTIAFDGRNLGHVESQAVAYGGLTLFQKILTSAAAVPNIGSPSEKFAGVLANPTMKVRRPLVTVSEPYFQDPDGWKRTKLDGKIAASVRKAFRRDFPNVDRCKDEQIAEKNWKFPDSALDLSTAYASNRHSFLVEASLDAGECGYVSDPNDPLSGPWFFVSPEGVVRRIGSFMELLDAGDYDNDDHSEVIFFLSQGENTDGFVLFDSTFGKPVALTWHYH